MRTFQCQFDAMVLVVVSALAYSALVGCSNSGQSNLSGSASQTSASRSPAEPTDADRLSTVRRFWTKRSRAASRAARTVGRRGEILWTGVAGVSHLQRRDPITADTVFDAGSASKLFTATAVLLLQQEGKLSVDDRPSRQVDGLPAWSDQITLAQPMHHVSGIPETEEILLNEGFQPKIVSSERRCERRSPPDPDNARQNSAWPDDRPAMWCGLHTHTREREREREKRRTPSLGAVSALQASMGSVWTLSSCTSAT
jgi:CubicO group peptidase (beta-lactamase class C family)